MTDRYWYTFEVLDGETHLCAALIQDIKAGMYFAFKDYGSDLNQYRFGIATKDSYMREEDGVWVVEADEVFQDVLELV